MTTLYRSLAIVLAFLALSAIPQIAYAQPDTSDPLLTGDSLTTDTTIFSNPGDTLKVDTSLVFTFDSSLIGDAPRIPLSTGRSGLWVGPTVEFTTLDPHDLDPQLGGSIVLIGAQGTLLWDGYVVGGAGVSGRLYDLPDNYDQFSFGYGGPIIGYDWMPGRQRTFSIRPMLLLGFGGLSMMKKRPDFVDSAEHQILERYRAEDFFLLRPGLSIGAQPIDWLEVRATADYLMPIGGENVGDLRKLTYGLQIVLGINFQ